MSDILSNPITVRPAVLSDAASMATILNAIIKEGGTTAHRHPFDAERMHNHYISPPNNVSCYVALEGDEIVGYQSLVEWQVEGRFVQGWASIASFVAIGHHGKGVGQKLFPATSAATQAAGISCIDATIRHENTGGQGYYEKVGFITYRQDEQTVSKKYTVA